jgi:septal ring factor EnvC (AmiA/AmiB activator)
VIIEKTRAEYDERISAINPKLKKFETEKEKFSKHIKKLEELNKIYASYLDICNVR